MIEDKKIMLTTAFFNIVFVILTIHWAGLKLNAPPLGDY